MKKELWDDLTAGQKKAFDKLQEFLQEPGAECFLLKGYAGTGKTFLIQILTNYLDRQQIPCRLMAPTGRAAKVMRSRLGSRSAQTIHSAIYRELRLEEYQTRTEEGSEDYKLVFQLGNNYDDARCVYIVDEASMVSDRKQEDEYLVFGSGRLLQDLLQFVDMDENNRRKIIFVGDAAQLPPVGDVLSHALEEEWLRSRYGCRVVSYELTQVVRQQGDSGILANATRLREDLVAGREDRVIVDTRFPDVQELDSLLTAQTYHEVRGALSEGKAIVIAYANEAVYRYNQMIRECLFGEAGILRSGEQVLLVRNCLVGGVSLYNGDFGLVLEVTDEVIRHYVRVPRKPEAIKVEFSFRRVQLRFFDEQGQAQDIWALINEKVLYSSERGLSPLEQQALYIDFKKRHRHLKPGTEAFVEAFLSDPYMNALQLKFGYAATCHKAQGGEWPYVFVDFSWPKGQRSKEYLRWAYTAITRAKQRLYCLYAPKVHESSGMHMADLQQTACVEAMLVGGDSLPALPEGWTAKNPQLEAIYQGICGSLAGTGIEVAAVRHCQFQEQYRFKQDGITAWVSFWYKQNGQVSKVSGDGSLLGQRAASLCQNLCHKQLLVLGRTEAAEMPMPRERAFPPEQPYLESFYLRLKAKTREKNIGIGDITHSSFQEKYEFLQGTQRCIVSFFYNKKGRFTTSQILKYQGETILQDIQEILAAVSTEG